MEQEKNRLMTAEQVIRQWLGRIGKKGGLAKSESKAAQARANLELARKIRSEQAKRK